MSETEAASFDAVFSEDALTESMPDLPAAEEPETVQPSKATEEPADGSGPEEVEEPGAEEVEAEDPEAAATAELGAEDNPYTVKNLPKDMHVQIKIDGEDQTVSVRELTEGHMRQAAYNRRVNEAKGMGERARAVVAQAAAKHEQFRQGVLNTLRTPAKLDAYMEEHHPEQWEAAIKLGVTRLVKLSRGTEEERRAYDRQRDRRSIDRERAALQAERQRVSRESQANASRDAKLSVVKPAWERAVAQVGSPQFEQTEAQDIMSEIGSSLEVAARRAQRDLTAPEAEKVMLRVLRANGYVAPSLTPPKRAKKAKAPAPVRGKPRRAAKKSDGDFSPGTDPGGAWSTDDLLG